MNRLKFDPYLFETLSIEGVPVYVKNVPYANGFVYIRVQMRIGARFDPEGKEGLAHFFEHLPFDGCVGWPTFDDIKKVSRTLFLDTLNASTSMERTVFSAKVSSKRIGEAFDFFRSFVFNPILDENEIERERKVITQEIWRRYDNEKKEELAKRFRRLEYGKHSFGRINSPAGWHDTVATITREDLVSYHKKNYHLGNVDIILVGDIDINKANISIKSFLENCPKGISIELPKPVDSWLVPSERELNISASEYFDLKGSSIPKVTHIDVVRNLPVIGNDQVLSVTTQVVRHLLFERIRGRLGATYSPSVSFGSYIDHQTFEISLGVDPKTEKDVKDIVLNVLSDLRNGDESILPMFDEIKSASMDRKVFYDPAVVDIANDASSDIAVKRKVESAEEECSVLDKVTYKDIVSFCKTYLQEDMLIWEIVRP